MKRIEILDAYSKLFKNSKGKIDEALKNEFFTKYNLIEWEGDFEKDFIKHVLIKDELKVEECSTQKEYEQLYEQKEKEHDQSAVEYQELKNKGMSDKEIIKYLIDKKLTEVQKEMDADFKKIERELDESDSFENESLVKFIWKQFLGIFRKENS